MAQVKKDTKEKKQVSGKTVKKAVKNKASKAAKTVKRTAKTAAITAKEMDSQKFKDILLKEEMKKEHKMIILTLSSILVAFFIYIGVTFVLQNVGSIEPVFEEIDLATYEKLSKGTNKETVYVATKNNDIQKEYAGVLEDALKGRKTKVKFLDLGVVKERNQLIGFMNTLELTKETYTDPMIVIFEDGTVKDFLLGSNTKKEITDFLDKNRID